MGFDATRLNPTYRNGGSSKLRSLRECNELSWLRISSSAGDADMQVLGDGAFVEGTGRARQFDLAVQRFVRDAQQRAVRHPQTITLGGDGAAFHIHRHGARQVDQRSLLAQRSSQLRSS